MELDTTVDDHTAIHSTPSRPTTPSGLLHRYRMKISPLPQQKEQQQNNAKQMQREYSHPKLSMEYSQDMTSTI